MKNILMIDDEKKPEQFDLKRFNIDLNDIIIARTFGEGFEELNKKSHWDFVLIDYNLKEFHAGRNGNTILQNLHCSIDTVLIITSDKEYQKRMVETCKMLKNQFKLIKTFYCL